MNLQNTQTKEDPIHQAKEAIYYRKQIKSQACIKSDDIKIFKKGKARIEKALDIETYYKRLQKLEIAINVLFNQTERQLIRHQKEFTLDSGRSSDSNYSDDLLGKDFSPNVSRLFTQNLVQGVTKHQLI